MPSHVQVSSLTPLDDAEFDESHCIRLLKTQLSVKELGGFGLDGRSAAIRAAGACLCYAQNTQRAAAAGAIRARVCSAHEEPIDLQAKHLVVASKTGAIPSNREILPLQHQPQPRQPHTSTATSPL